MRPIERKLTRARSFVAGDYPGAPVAYVMALMTVAAMMAVLLVDAL